MGLFQTVKINSAGRSRAVARRVSLRGLLLSIGGLVYAFCRVQEPKLRFCDQVWRGLSWRLGGLAPPKVPIATALGLSIAIYCFAKDALSPLYSRNTP